MTNPPQFPQNYQPTLTTPPQPPSPAGGHAAPYNGTYYGPHATRPPVVVRPPSMWSRVPVVYWVALGIGALAFVVRISYQHTSIGSDGYSCSYTDFAGFLTAGALVLLTVAGWATRAARRAADRLPLPLMAALTVLFLALAFVHALRGSGTIMSPCDAMPLP